MVELIQILVVPVKILLDVKNFQDVMGDVEISLIRLKSGNFVLGKENINEDEIIECLDCGSSNPGFQYVIDEEICNNAKR